MKDYFCGWYFKIQTKDKTIAIIPAIHGAGQNSTCSIQFISDTETVFLAEVKGWLQFSDLTPIKYDIMGPFQFVPFMECRHSVYSMKHRVDGVLKINGAEYQFENVLGYWEGDRGHSFPKEYAWTHCFLEEKGVLQGSLMLSIADIPLAGFHFTGIIGIVYWKDKEYRFATYLGARVVQKGNRRLLIRQGHKELEVRLLEKQAHPLQAPIDGKMHRIIRENIRCKAFYRLRIKGQTIFVVQADNASFEYELKE
ncbi:MAG: hypothetical protein IJO60_06845 [Agathobacter sp.]|nr:hypothetical protein [Agathobacter sp.]